MVSKLIGPLVALLFSTITGFAVFATVVFVASGGADGGGQAAVGNMTREAIGLVTAVLGGVIDLMKAIFATITRSLDS